MDRGASDERRSPQSADDSGAQNVAQTQEPIPAPKPSQAEGDRETIEEDLRDKGVDGES
jgi:hypothetical protein